ncbi:MAG: DNA translocase FtsK 4TM domain-containing protein, partial [Pseudonocardiaceae bacterium]
MRRGRKPTLARGLTSTWTLLARGAGQLARAVGRTRELEPEHRRDGLALGLVALAVVAAASVWWAAGGPAGSGVQHALRTLFGTAAAVLPVVLAAVAVTLMRTEPDVAARPRRTVGTLLLALGALGLWHLMTGAPVDGAGRYDAAGVIGFLVANPLVDGFTVWVAAPLLALLAIYGLLVLTGTPVRAVPDRIRQLVGVPGSEPDPEQDSDAEVSEADPATVRLRRASRRRQATRAPEATPAQDAPDAAPAPKAKPAASVPTLAPTAESKAGTEMSVRREVEGDYVLPPPRLLLEGDPPKA